MKVLIAPVDSASFATRLGRALASKGVECHVFKRATHMYHSDVSFMGGARPVAAQAVGLVERVDGPGFFRRQLAHLLRGLIYWYVFIWSCFAMDAIVFVAVNRSLLRWNLDQYVYRWLGKRVIRVYLGSDSRPPFMAYWDADYRGSLDDPAAVEKFVAELPELVRRLQRMARLSDYVVDNPLCGHLHGKSFINWFHIGFPHDEALFGGLRESEPHVALRILHCPSKPQIKGTDHIEATIHKLQREGMAIDYQRITGMPRSEVLERLAECDLVVDELYSDAPLAGFGTEAAAFGKPVIVGGYGWSELADCLPEDKTAPSIRCTDQTFEQTLREAISDREGRERVGRASYDFMNGYWSQQAVAERFIQLLDRKSEVPSEWWCEPKRLSYYLGMGASQSQREKIYRLVCQHGCDKLGLDKDSALYKALRERFAD